MFSVVIPLYNKELSIRNTIQSVLDQTFQDFEMVIVNDGSTDNSVKEVDKFEDKRIRLIHQKNQGVSAARNRGIEEAKYEWVAFLDADDLWKAVHLSEYKMVIQENVDLTWLISGYTSQGDGMTREYIYKKSGILENVFEDLLNGLSIHTSTVCIKKILFERYPDLYFRVGMNNSEDREVWYKLCCIDKQPYYIDKALSIYDVDVPNSLTNLKSMTDKEHFLSMIDRLRDFECFNNIEMENRKYLEKYIYSFNRLQLGSRYVMGYFKEEHKEHLPTIQYYLYKYTVFFSYTLRRITNRIYRFLLS